MANDFIRLSELTEASDAQVDNNALMELSVVNIEADSGYETKKSPLSKLANYILNKFNTLPLGGSARTVKAAIDAHQSRIASLSDDMEYVEVVLGDSPMGTTANTVTGAIAEINNNLSFTVKSFSASAYTIAANSAHGFSASDFSVSTPDGYEPMAVVYYSTGQASCSVYSINARASGDGRMMSVMNTGSGSLTISPGITIMYVKSGTYHPLT